MARFYFALLGLVLIFAHPLAELLTFAWGSELYSYIPLIPLVSLGLAWRRPELAPTAGGAERFLAPCFLGLSGALYLAGKPDRLSLSILGFVLGVAGIGCGLGRPGAARRHAFSLGLLLLMVPLPAQWVDRVAGWLQYSSAWLAAALLELTGMPVYQSGGLDLKIPGINLHVAPECSGVHSTLALAITALIAGYVYLRSPWHRALFCLMAFPLGVVRNAFRIFTIAQLCVRLGPQMIDSSIHRKGGWIFFLLFLGPALLLLRLLRRSERRPLAVSPFTDFPCSPSVLPLKRH